MISLTIHPKKSDLNSVRVQPAWALADGAATAACGAPHTR
jgi:hypothetical protein